MNFLKNKLLVMFASSCFLLKIQIMGKSTGVYLSDEQLKAVKAKADTLHRGKISAYLAELVDRDLSDLKSTPEPMSPTVISDLMRKLCGELDADELSDLLAHSYETQPAILRKLLEGLLTIERLRGRDVDLSLLPGSHLSVLDIPDVCQQLYRRTHQPAISLHDLIGQVEREMPPSAHNTIPKDKTA